MGRWVWGFDDAGVEVWDFVEGCGFGDGAGEGIDGAELVDVASVGAGVEWGADVDGGADCACGCIGRRCVGGPIREIVFGAGSQ